jgi:hypothetical protein
MNNLNGAAARATGTLCPAHFDHVEAIEGVRS